MTRLDEIEDMQKEDKLIKIPDGVKDVTAYIICIEFNTMRRHSVNASKEAIQMNEYSSGLKGF